MNPHFNQRFLKANNRAMSSYNNNDFFIPQLGASTSDQHYNNSYNQNIDQQQYYYTQLEPNAQSQSYAFNPTQHLNEQLEPSYLYHESQSVLPPKTALNYIINDNQPQMFNNTDNQPFMQPISYQELPSSSTYQEPLSTSYNDYFPESPPDSSYYMPPVIRMPPRNAPSSNIGKNYVHRQLAQNTPHIMHRPSHPRQRYEVDPLYGRKSSRSMSHMSGYAHPANPFGLSTISFAPSASTIPAATTAATTAAAIAAASAASASTSTTTTAAFPMFDSFAAYGMFPSHVDQKQPAPIKPIKRRSASKLPQKDVDGDYVDDVLSSKKPHRKSGSIKKPAAPRKRPTRKAAAAALEQIQKTTENTEPLDYLFEISSPLSAASLDFADPSVYEAGHVLAEAAVYEEGPVLAGSSVQEEGSALFGPSEHEVDSALFNPSVHEVGSAPSVYEESHAAATSVYKEGPIFADPYVQEEGSVVFGSSAHEEGSAPSVQEKGFIPSVYEESHVAATSVYKEGPVFADYYVQEEGSVLFGSSVHEEGSASSVPSVHEEGSIFSAPYVYEESHAAEASVYEESPVFAGPPVYEEVHVLTDSSVYEEDPVLAGPAVHKEGSVLSAPSLHEEGSVLFAPAVYEEGSVLTGPSVDEEGSVLSGSVVGSQVGEEACVFVDLVDDEGEEVSAASPVPSSLVPSSLVPSSLAPSSLAPSSLAPSSLAPSSLVSASPVSASPVSASPVPASPVSASPVPASPVSVSPVFASPVARGKAPVVLSPPVNVEHRARSLLDVGEGSSSSEALHVRKKRRALDEHEWSLTNRKSDLSSTDIKSVLEGLLKTLPPGDLEAAADLLPWTDKTGASPNLANNNFFWEAAGKWQEVLSLGGFEEKKDEEEEEEGPAHRSPFKDDAYETYWGERLERDREAKAAKLKSRGRGRGRGKRGRGRGRGGG